MFNLLLCVLLLLCVAVYQRDEDELKDSKSPRFKLSLLMIGAKTLLFTAETLSAPFELTLFGLFVLLLRFRHNINTCATNSFGKKLLILSIRAVSNPINRINSMSSFIWKAVLNSKKYWVRSSSISQCTWQSLAAEISIKGNGNLSPCWWC